MSACPTNLVPLTVLCLLILIVLIYMALGISATFAADDWCGAADVRQFGVLGAVSHSYVTWSGRYTQLFITNAFYAILGLRAPMVASALILGFLTLIAWHRGGESGLMLLCAVLLGLKNNIWQGVYWMPGLLTYVLPILLGLLLTRETRPALAFVIAFAAAGCNESMGLVIALGALLWRKWSALSGALLGVIIVLAAPGNAVRAEYLVSPGLQGAWLLTGTTLLTTLPLVAAVFAFVAGTQRKTDTNWRVMTLAVMSVFLGLFPTAYAVGVIAPRTLILPICAVLLLCYHLGQTTAHRYQERGYIFIAAFMFALAVSFSFTAAGRSFAELAQVDDGAQWVRDCAARI